MLRIKSKLQRRKRRHKRVRAKINGTSNCPRLSIFRSNQHVWVQLIDDTTGHTICAAGDRELPKSVKGTLAQKGEKTGELIAKKAVSSKIVRVSFDRGGYAYHGVVQAVAEGARRGGLKF